MLGAPLPIPPPQKAIKNPRSRPTRIIHSGDDEDSDDDY